MLIIKCMLTIFDEKKKLTAMYNFSRNRERKASAYIDSE